MGIMTATEFAKNIKKTLDRLEFGGEEIVITRNNNKIARLIPGSAHMTALEPWQICIRPWHLRQVRIGSRIAVCRFN